MSDGWEIVTSHEEDEDDFWDEPNEYSSDGGICPWSEDDLISGYSEWADACAMWWRWRRCPVCGRVVVAYALDAEPPDHCEQDAVAISKAWPEIDPGGLPF